MSRCSEREFGSFGLISINLRSSNYARVDNNLEIVDRWYTIKAQKCLGQIKIGPKVFSSTLFHWKRFFDRWLEYLRTRGQWEWTTIKVESLRRDMQVKAAMTSFFVPCSLLLRRELTWKKVQHRKTASGVHKVYQPCEQRFLEICTRWALQRRKLARNNFYGIRSFFPLFFSTLAKFSEVENIWADGEEGFAWIF